MALYSLALVSGYLDVPCNRSTLQTASSLVLQSISRDTKMAVTETGALEAFKVEGNKNRFNLAYPLVPTGVSYI